MDGVMFKELLRLLRRAVRLEVRRRRVQTSMQLEDQARGKRRIVAQLAKAQRDVETLGDDIDRAHREVHLQSDRRVSRKEFHEERLEKHGVVRRAYAQASARLELAVRRELGHGVD